jgi:hypothetical protein
LSNGKILIEYWLRKWMKKTRHGLIRSSFLELTWRNWRKAQKQLRKLSVPVEIRIKHLQGTNRKCCRLNLLHYRLTAEQEKFYVSQNVARLVWIFGDIITVPLSYYLFSSFRSCSKVIHRRNSYSSLQNACLVSEPCWGKFSYKMSECLCKIELYLGEILFVVLHNYLGAKYLHYIPSIQCTSVYINI